MLLRMVEVPFVMGWPFRSRTAKGSRLYHTRCPCELRGSSGAISAHGMAPPWRGGVERRPRIIAWQPAPPQVGVGLRSSPLLIRSRRQFAVSSCGILVVLLCLLVIWGGFSWALLFFASSHLSGPKGALRVSARLVVRSVRVFVRMVFRRQHCDGMRCIATQAPCIDCVSFTVHHPQLRPPASSLGEKNFFSNRVLSNSAKHETTRPATLTLEDLIEKNGNSAAYAKVRRILPSSDFSNACRENARQVEPSFST